MVASHHNITHIDEGALDWLIMTYKPYTFLDIGCGPMGMVELALSKGLDAYGLDADIGLRNTVKYPERLFMANLNDGIYTGTKKYDIIWSVETAEHIKISSVFNYLFTVKHNLSYDGIFVMTHATPESGKPAHGNCKDSAWWISQFATATKLSHLLKATDLLKNSSTMEREFMKDSGKVFCHSKRKGDLYYV